MDRVALGDKTMHDRQRNRLILAVLGVGSLIPPTLIHTTQLYAADLGIPELRSWADVLVGSGLPYLGLWLMLMPGVFLACRRIELDPRRPGQALLTHLPLAAAFVVVHGAVYHLLVGHELATGAGRVVEGSFIFLAPGLLNLVSYALLVGAGYGRAWAEEAREGVRREADLRAEIEALAEEATASDLRAMKLELHPHLLLNTLNGISGLVMSGDSDRAVRMQALLGDMLRRSLYSSGVHEVSVREELEYLELYLSMERIRYQDRVHIELDVDPEALEGRIPFMVVQPLVENALKHGVFGEGSGRVRVHVRREGQGHLLRISVEDDGPGVRTHGTRVPGGLGLANTRRRLKAFYGIYHEFRLYNSSEGGAIATITVPFRNEPGSLSPRKRDVSRPA